MSNGMRNGRASRSPNSVVVQTEAGERVFWEVLSHHARRLRGDGRPIDDVLDMLGDHRALQHFLSLAVRLEPPRQLFQLVVWGVTLHQFLHLLDLVQWAHLPLDLLQNLLERGLVGPARRFVKSGVHPSILPASRLAKSEAPR